MSVKLGNMALDYQYFSVIHTFSPASEPHIFWNVLPVLVTLYFVPFNMFLVGR